MKPERMKTSGFNSSIITSLDNGESVCVFHIGMNEGNKFTDKREEKLRRAKEVEYNSNFMADLHSKIKDESGITELGTILKQNLPELYNYLNND